MSAPIEDDRPGILFDADLVRVLGISLRTLKRLRRLRACPIPELPRLDRKHRYSRRDLDAYLNRETGLTMTRRRSA